MNQSDKISKRFFSLAVLILFLFSQLPAQIQITPATDDPYNPINLIENVFLGDGVEILDIKYDGASVATGVFSTAAGDIVLERGIVISTGEVNKVSAPNDDTIEDSSGSSGDAVFDADLANLVTDDLRDVAKYEITFRPISDNLRFRYVFASEEYPEFVCGKFNDVFGFFISGPNPNGDDYVSENIALVPDPADPSGLTFTDFPVYTNSINPGDIGSSSTEAEENCTKENESLNFSQYYNDNSGSSSLVFDGFSDVFIAQADVIACEEYTIKLAIGDVSDGSFNSAVFLEAKSFSSPTLKVDRQDNSTVDGSISEGCTDATFRFKLPAVAERDTLIELNLVTDAPFAIAEQGVDYTIFPSANVLVVEAGSDEVELTIRANFDEIEEQEESILLAYQKNICTIDTLRIVIRDKVIETLELEEADEPYCTEGYTVQATAPGGSTNTLTPFTSTQLINISEANKSYSDIIRVDGVEPSILTPGLISKICIDDLEHRVPEDLDIYITSPGGQVLELSTDNGSIGTPDNTVFDKFTNTCFTVNANQNINNGNALAGQPFAGNLDYNGEFLPEGDWDDLFTGENPSNGDWKLTIIDDSGNGDGSGGNSTDGNLRGWSIEFNAPYEVVYNWTTIDGNNDGTISDPSILNTTFTPAQTQSYVLEAIDSYGCSVKDTITVTPGEQVIPPTNVRCAAVTSTSFTAAWELVDMPSDIQVVLTLDTLTIADDEWESVGLVQQRLYDNLESNTEYFIGVRSVGVGCVGDPEFVSCITDACTPPAFELALRKNPSSCRDDGMIVLNPSDRTDLVYEIDGVVNPDGHFRDLIGGSYLVKVTDETGCFDTIRVDLVKDTFTAVLFIEREIECFGGMTGTIRAEPRPLPANGGFLPINWKWSTGESGPEFGIFGLGADTYTVTITNEDNCEAVGMITLDQPPEFRAEANPIATPLSCKDANDGTLSVPVFGGTPPYRFQWDDPLGQTDSIAVGLSPGDYTVVVTDALNCTLPPIIGSVPVNNGFNVLQGTVSAPKCAGGSDGVASFMNSNGAEPLTWTWTNEAGDTVATTNEATDLASGNYKIEVVDANGCPEFREINIPTVEAVVFETFKVDSSRCFNTTEGSISLTAAGGTGVYQSFDWISASDQQQLAGVSIGNTETISNLAVGMYNVTITDTNGCPRDTSFIVESPPPFEFEATIDTVACFGDASGGINAEMTGAVSPYDYEWFGPTGTLTVEDPSGLFSDTYGLRVTDDVGCMFEGSVFVPENDKLIPSLLPNNIACKNESSGSIEVFLDGGKPGFSFLWEQNGNPIPLDTRKIEGLIPANYAVTIMDALGCVADTNYLITEPAAEFLVSVIQDTICKDAFEPGRLSVIATGGEPDYTYAWSDGSSEPIKDFFAGDYSVIVSDRAGCEREVEASVVEVTNFDILSIDASPAKCNNEANGSASIDLANVSYEFGNENLEIIDVLWEGFPENKELTIDILNGGRTYTVQLTDEYGCRAIDSVFVENPQQFELTVDTIMDVACFAEENGSISIDPVNGQGPYEYLWSPSTNSQTTKDAVNLRRGFHDVVVTDVNGCKTTKSFEVQEPALLQVDGRGVKTLCFGDNSGRVDLLVSGGTPEYQYRWSDDSSEENILNVGVGSYTVTVTDKNNCQAIEDIEVEGPTEELDFEFEVVPPKCPGTNSGLIEVTATGGNGFYLYSYDETTFTQNETLVGLVDGTYSITVKDKNGCSLKKDSIVISNPDAMTLSIGGDTIIPAGDNLFVGTNLQNGVDPIEYNWTINPGEVGYSDFDEFIEIMDLQESAIVSLTVIDSLGCTVTATRQVDVESLLNNQVMVPTGFTPNGDGANDFLRVLGRDGVVINSFKVYSRWGELVYSESEFLLDLNNESQGWNGVFKGKAMNPDTFVWVIEATFEDGFQAVYKGNTQLLR